MSSRNPFSRVKALSLSVFLTLQGLFIPVAVAKTTTTKNQPTTESTTEVAGGIFDIIIDNLTGGENVCLPLVGCVDPGKVAEGIFIEALRKELTPKNAPILVQTQQVFPTSSRLPGGEMQQVQLIDLMQVPSDAVIPPGDYIIPVTGYCLERSFSSPNGHRYQLAPLGGRRQNIMQDFLYAAAQQDLDVSTTQGVVWGIRSGMDYDDMPRSMQSVIRQTIPQHRQTLATGSFLKEIRGISNEALRMAGYGNLDTMLRRELGDFGTVAVELMALENDLHGNDDWRSLSNRFLNERRRGIGGIERTPWSELYPGIHARFVTEKNAGDVGFLLVRVSPGYAYKSKQKTVASTYTKSLPKMSDINTGLTSGDLLSITGNLVAIPEGSGNIQPLALQPYPKREVINREGVQVAGFFVPALIAGARGGIEAVKMWRLLQGTTAAAGAGAITVYNMQQAPPLEPLPGFTIDENANKPNILTTPIDEDANNPNVLTTPIDEDANKPLIESFPATEENQTLVLNNENNSAEQGDTSTKEDRTTASGSRYITPPKNLPAFPDAKVADRKTPVRGGGGLRKRWKDKKKNIYEWDSQHGKVEKYDPRGKHLGEFDPVTGEQTKPADPTRKVSP